MAVASFHPLDTPTLSTIKSSLFLYLVILFYACLVRLRRYSQCLCSSPSFASILHSRSVSNFLQTWSLCIPLFSILPKRRFDIRSCLSFFLPCIAPLSIRERLGGIRSMQSSNNLIVLALSSSITRVRLSVLPRRNTNRLCLIPDGWSMIQ